MEKNSFVFFENTYTHDGQHRLYANWDFVTLMKQKEDSPLNWEEPVNYCDGTYDFEVDVIEMGEVTSPVKIQFGWINTPGDLEYRHIASPQIAFSKPGSYKLSGVIKEIENYYGGGPKQDEVCHTWYWNEAYCDGTIYTLINPEDNMPGAEGFPCKVHVKLTIHSR